MSKEREYHFSLGDSSDGAIGFCARIRGNSEEEALKKLQEALPDSIMVPYEGSDSEYVQVYFNSAAITVLDVDDVDES